MSEFPTQEQSSKIPLDLEQVFQPVPGAYTDFDVPVLAALEGWNQLFPFLNTGNYIVVFESVRKEDAMSGKPLGEDLCDLDEKAYEEVTQSPGFRGYFRGPLDPQTRKCRSFCIWDNVESARLGSKLPNHQEAVRRTGEFYDDYSVGRYEVVRGDEGQISFVPVATRRSSLS